MRLILWSTLVAVSIHLFAASVAGQSLDRTAQRAVNDATNDLKSRNVQKRVEAIDHLATWGKLPTAPLIIGALKDPDARVRAAAAGALWDDAMKTPAAKAPLTAALDDPAPEVAVLAAGALRILGVARAEVRHANERGLSTSSDQRIRFLAARALIGLLPPSRLVDALLTYLERQVAGDARRNVELAEQALEELRDTNDRTMLTPLMEAIPRMARGAHVVLKVLGKVLPRPDGWTALLMSQAVHTDAAVRRESLLLMRDVKADADVAQWSPVAGRLLGGDADPVVRSYAADALGFAGGSAHAQAGAVLAAARSDVSAGVRSSALDALTSIIGRTGTAPMNVKTAMAKTALPVIQVLIESDPDADVRESAVEALDALALEAPQSAALLVAVANKTSLAEGLRTQAVSKLRNRGPEARSVAADLQKLKSDPSAGVRERATEALERLADRSASAARSAAPAPTASTTGAADELRGLSVIRARKKEFAQDQFYRAIGEADLELARAFLDAGMSANNPFPFGNKATPLMAAVAGTACSATVRPTAPSVLSLLQLLIARGADASITDEHGNTPLMQAAMGGCDAAVMAALLKAGARVDAVNQAGLSAFEAGLFWGHDGLDELVAAGYRLPAQKVKVYLEAYKENPKAVALVKRATP